MPGPIKANAARRGEPEIIGAGETVVRPGGLNTGSTTRRPSEMDSPRPAIPLPNSNLGGAKDGRARATVGR